MTEEKKDLKSANAVYKTLCDTLDARNWNYKKGAERLRIVTNVRGKRSSMPIELILKVRADRHLVLLLSKIPIDVAKNRRTAVAVAVSQANYKILDGDFDYSYLNGEIIFRMTVGYNGCTIGQSMLEYMIDCACGTIDRVNPIFLQVAKNNMSLDQVVEYIKKELV